MDRSLIINTSAGFGDGIVDDFMKSRKVAICEIYNKKAHGYPTERRIRRCNTVQEVSQNDDDESYVSKCEYKVGEAMSVFTPDIIFYVAGYDVLKGDRYGNMSITGDGVMM